MNKKSVKRIITSSVMFVIKPFIIPILIIAILLSFVCTITDILYIAFNNEETIDLKEEMKYYDAKIEYEKEEMNGFFSSVWDFVEKIFGAGEISDETDWPVERSI